jgi:hypothetical protein
VLPAAQIERVLRDYYAGHLGDADLEDRLLHNVDEGKFRAICQNALEGLASTNMGSPRRLLPLIVAHVESLCSNHQGRMRGSRNGRAFDWGVTIEGIESGPCIVVTIG